MQATFDNKINLLTANIRSSVDDSILYSITTSHNLWGRTVTLLKDANPAPGNSPIVGAIYWRERLFMVHGHRKPIKDIKRRPPGFAHALDTKHTQNAQRQRTQSLASKKDGITATDKAPSRKIKGAAGKMEGLDGDRKRKRSKSVTIASPPTIISPLQHTSNIPLPSAILSKFGLGSWWRSMSSITRYWRWSTDRTEYEMTYHHERWKALPILDQDRKHHYHHHHEKNTLVPGTHVRYSTASAGRDSGSDDMYHSKHRRSVSFSSWPSRLSAEKALEDDLFGETTKEDKEDQHIAASLCIPHRNHLFHKNRSPVLHIKPPSLLQDEVFLILVFIYSETKRQDKTNSSGGW